MDGFVHLHVHSNYSLRQGAARVEELPRAAAERGMQALALTDHDGMYGAVRFTQSCIDAGVRPILGAELEWGDGYHVTLLAQDRKGWSNLCRLVSSMHLDERAQSLQPGRRPRTTFEAIAERSEGLFALSGCPRGEVSWLAGLRQTDEAAQAIDRWVDVFGPERFAIELNDHLEEHDAARNRRLYQLAQEAGVRAVATNNVQYIDRSDAPVHDVLDCIRRIVALTPRTAPRRTAEYDLKTPQQMAQLHPEDAVANTAWVAERCTYQLELGEFHFPDLPADQGGADSSRGESATSVLARRAFEGLRRRYPKITKRIDERLQMELREIRRQGFCGYFLLVAGIVEYAKEQLGIRCACRGSAAGSLVAFALGISDVDPIHHNLAFERFMNRHRREIPDIDIDFPSDRREDINRYILETYGERTAMVAMMETFRARAALREVGKALGLPPVEIDAVAKAFPHISAGKIHEALKALPEVSDLDLKSSRLEVLFDLACRLDGFPRHLAMHPSGVILSDENLRDIMPMQRSYEGFLMSQFDKDDVEALGVAKLDVLGVRMLSAMAHAVDEVERIDGVRIDIDSIPFDDEPTFELIRDSRTLGCFQIESPGQRELLGKFQPTRFEDLVIDISLFRPGPVKSDMISPFLMRRHGFETVSYPHPSLKPVLAETNGVIVYHEQVMRVISALTGCDLGEADRIRRLLDNTFEAPDPETGKPASLSPAQMKLREQVVVQAVERGWNRALVERIWDDVLQFASFGFCKAHAAAFAVPTYQSAWLKTHHTAAFYAGVLTHDPGMYPRRAIISDARSHGVPILPVDVNRSWADYRVEMAPSGVPGIRLALRDIKGISGAEVQAIIDGRAWRSFSDFTLRAEVDRPTVESLIHCGAFDAIKGRRTRRELLWMVEERWSERVRARAEQQTFDLNVAEELQLPGLEDYTDREKVQAELEVLGMDATAHIMSFYADELRRIGHVPAADLRNRRSGSRVVVAGIKVATQTPPVKSGKRVIFLTLEDGTGQADVTFFEEAQRRYARKVFDSWILAVRGTVRRTGEKGVSILAEEVVDLGGETPAPTRLWHRSGGSAG